MKILAIGDPHGTLPKNLNKIIKDEKIDLVLCPGDLPDAGQISKYLFKYAHKIKGKQGLIGPDDLAKIKGEAFVNKLKNQAFKSWKNIRKQLEYIKTPIIIVGGNTGETSSTPWYDIEAEFDRDFDITLEEWAAKHPNIHVLEYSSIKFNKYIIAGFGVKYSQKLTNISGKGRKPWPNWRKRARAEKKRKLPKLLRNPRKTILLVHEPPLGSTDKIIVKGNPRYGQHVGDDILRESIEKYQPLLVINGHVHGNFGVDKIGKTVILNAGAYGNYSIIEINGEKIKIKLKQS